MGLIRLVGANEIGTLFEDKRCKKNLLLMQFNLHDADEFLL